MQILLPSFEKQKQAARIAQALNLTQAESIRRAQNPFVRRVSDMMMAGSWLDKVLGAKRRETYNLLGIEKKYEVYVAQVFFQSLLVALLPVMLGAMIDEPILYMFGPTGLIIFLRQGLRRITTWDKQRRNDLIQDLPLLVSGMITALAVGAPLRDVFEQVSQRCHPLLAHFLNRLIADLNSMPLKQALQRFADSINMPEIYDFVSVVNVIVEKGFKESEEDLNGIQNDIQRLNRLSLEIRTEGNPQKLNRFYLIMIGHVLVFVFLMMMKLFAAMNSL